MALSCGYSSCCCLVFKKVSCFLFFKEASCYGVASPPSVCAIGSSRPRLGHIDSQSRFICAPHDSCNNFAILVRTKAQSDGDFARSEPSLLCECCHTF